MEISVEDLKPIKVKGLLDASDASDGRPCVVCWKVVGSNAIDTGSMRKGQTWAMEHKREREANQGKFSPMSYFTHPLALKNQNRRIDVNRIYCGSTPVRHTHTDLFLGHLALFASTSASTCCEFDV